MPRFTKKAVLLAKLETTYGTDAIPTGVANAMSISNVSYDLMYDSVERQIMRPHFGAQQSLHNTRFAKLTGEVELAPSGVAGTAPAYGVLLRACAMAETITATTRVEYSPVTDGQESSTLYFYLDGAWHKLIGAMGTFELSMNEGEIPVLKFDFTGIDGGVVEGALPAVTLTAWKTPQLVTSANSAGLKFGGAYAAGVLTGGVQFPSRGLSVTLGNDVKPRRMLNTQSVAIVERKATGSVQMELTAAQEVALINDINAQTLSTLSFEHGTAAGSKVLAFCPSVQRLSPKRTDQDGIAQMSVELTLLPSAANDELRLVFA
jgi:hypothetical protein